MCKTIGANELTDDPRFARNPDRVRNRQKLIPLINIYTETKPAGYWINELEKAGVPCGPVNDLAQTFADPQVIHREMAITMDHFLAGSDGVKLIGNPLNFGETPVAYRKAPPVRGEDTQSVLKARLGLDDARLKELEANGTIECRKKNN